MHAGRHPVDVSDDIQVGAIREESTVCRVHGAQVEPVLEPLVDAGERLFDERWHRQDGRPGVEPVAVDLEETGAAAGHTVAFQDSDGAAGAGES
jgi:hypothetical protein